MRRSLKNCLSVLWQRLKSCFQPKKQVTRLIVVDDSFAFKKTAAEYVSFLVEHPGWKAQYRELALQPFISADRYTEFCLLFDRTLKDEAKQHIVKNSISPLIVATRIRVRLLDDRLRISYYSLPHKEYLYERE
jgi:hypothetical protein